MNLIDKALSAFQPHLCPFYKSISHLDRLVSTGSQGSNQGADKGQNIETIIMKGCVVDLLGLSEDSSYLFHHFVRRVCRS